MGPLGAVESLGKERAVARSTRFNSISLSGTAPESRYHFRVTNWLDPAELRTPRQMR